MNHSKLAETAAKGIDTADFLGHIAWTEVIRPLLLRDREALTRQLVDLTLRPPSGPSESREQVAGKIFGIDHTLRVIEKLVRDGDSARAELAAQNLYLQ